MVPRPVTDVALNVGLTRLIPRYLLVCILPHSAIMARVKELTPSL